MALAPIEKIGEAAAREREELATGVRRPPILKHAVQRAAARALAVFLILMLALTLLSRAADGITVARVKVETARTGVLTQRVTVGGTIEAQGDLELTLPEGIRVTRISVSKGQAVQVGDVLLELDADALALAVEKLENDLKLLDLKISNAAQGKSGSGTDAIVNAQAALAAVEQALIEKQEDYDRLTAGREKTETRAGEDVLQAQEDYDAALAALDKAKVKAKEELVKATQEKLEAAKEALADTKESAREAKEAAQQSLDAARDSASTMDGSYYNALDAYDKANRAVTAAQADYDAALAGGDEAAISAAYTVLLQAQSSRAAAEGTLNTISGQSSDADKSVKRAKDNLEAVIQKWDEKVKKAEAALAEAENKLAEVQAKTDMSEEALVISAQSAVDGAERALKTAQRGTEDAVDATATALLTAQRELNSAQRSVDSARRTLDQANSAAGREQAANQSANRQTEIERLGYVSERREVQRKLDELRAISNAGGVLTAPIAGTVLDLMAETGATQEGQKVAVLSRSDRGFEFAGKVSEADAEKLSPGDEAKLSYTKDGKSQETSAVILSIGAVDEKGEVEVRASLPEGNWPTGVSAKLEISKRSEQYQTTLPLGALRSDAGGTFVLVLREKDTVMGTEQTVEKVSVKVKAKDSEMMALEDGMLAYGEQVLTSANKPVSEGDRVRLETGE